LYKVTYQFIDRLSPVSTRENLYYFSNRNSWPRRPRTLRVVRVTGEMKVRKLF